MWENEAHYNRPGVLVRDVHLKFRRENQALGLDNGIRELFKYITREYDEDDWVGISISSDFLPNGPAHQFRKLRAYTFENLWSMIHLIDQSRRE